MHTYPHWHTERQAPLHLRSPCAGARTGSRHCFSCPRAPELIAPHIAMRTATTAPEATLTWLQSRPQRTPGHMATAGAPHPRTPTRPLRWVHEVHMFRPHATPTRSLRWVARDLHSPLAYILAHCHHNWPIGHNIAYHRQQQTPIGGIANRCPTASARHIEQPLREHT